MIASMYIVSKRWRPPSLVIVNKEELSTSLSSFMPKTHIESRIDELGRLVQNHCPSHHVDFYIFLVAVVCIICSAVFTFVARSQNISMWFPLLLLLVPIALSFWTSKRKIRLLIKIREFESILKKTLYEYSLIDSHRRVAWSLQRVPIHEAPYKSARFCLMITVKELDPELGCCYTLHSTGEELPTYQAATHLPPSYNEIIQPPDPVVILPILTSSSSPSRAY